MPTSYKDADGFEFIRRSHEASINMIAGQDPTLTLYRAEFAVAPNGKERPMGRDDNPIVKRGSELAKPKFEFNGQKYTGEFLMGMLAAGFDKLDQDFLDEKAARDNPPPPPPPEPDPTAPADQ